MRGVVAVALIAAGVATVDVHAQGVELPTLQARRLEGAVVLDTVATVTLNKTVEDALRRGVPVTFVATATLYHPRWYWRDEKVARVGRSWRLSFQPLTSQWRVSLGGFSQSYSTLDEAMQAITRLPHWKITEPGQVDLDEKLYVEFSYRLDAAQLPRPMQIELTTQADWQLGVDRTVKVE